MTKTLPVAGETCEIVLGVLLVAAHILAALFPESSFFQTFYQWTTARAPVTSVIVGASLILLAPLVFVRSGSLAIEP